MTFIAFTAVAVAAFLSGIIFTVILACYMENPKEN